MKKLLNYLPLHFLLFIILGIIVQFNLNLWQIGFYNFLLVFLILLIFLLVFKNRFLRTFLALILFFCIGLFIVFCNDNRNFENYYNKHLTEKSFVKLSINKILKPGNYYYKYEANVVQVDSVKTIGRVLLNINKKDNDEVLKVENQIYLSTTFKNLIPPLNPHQFNYKSYLAKQGIHHQLFVNNNEFLLLKNSNFSLLGLSAKFRRIIQNSLQKYSFSKDEFAVISALLLGQRQDISKELITDYSRAGAIHILAVSGLHVGIILLILSFILKPFEKIKHGKFLKAFLIVLFLWMFAFIAGLSASVVRAVTMFTFLAIGSSFNKKNVVWFSLISSMFFLLIVRPMFLFDVGFQLSYLAVFGIVWIQPKLYTIWNPKFKVIDFFWRLFTVSIAAQVGILPLSIYYFYQFPGLFIASNLVIIPFLGFILMGGILVILLAVLNILPQFLADIYGAIISYMNAFVSWISKQEDFLLQELHLSFLLMIAFYGSMFLGLQFFIKRKLNIILYFLVSIIVVQSIFLFQNKVQSTQKEFIVFHKSRKSLVGKRIGKNLFLKHNLDSLIFKENSIKQYKINEGINEVIEGNFKNLKTFNNKKILFIDSLGIYKLKELEEPIIVLQYSPRINIRRLIKELKPVQIIADGSNYKTLVLNWERISKENNIPFHYTGQKGAFILKE